MACEKNDEYVGFSCCHVCARKYVAQVESDLAAMTKDRDELREAVRVLGRSINTIDHWGRCNLSPEYFWDRHAADHAREEVKKAILANPIALAAVEGGRP